MAFDKEQQTYSEHEDELLQSDAGKFALISGADILGVFATYADACTAGYLKCGIAKPFMVRQICGPEEAQLNTHLFRPFHKCP